MATTRTRLSRGESWTTIASCKCEIYQAHLPDLVARVEAGGTLLIAPCAFFGTGLFLDIDGTVIVGMPAVRPDQVSRSRTEDLARRLKVLADPTRLAIVDYLFSSPRSVGDIAEAFGLAQPTVSNHLKVLREAGLVISERDGGRLAIHADRRAIADVASELQTIAS